MFPEPTELLFDRINMDPKIQIKYIDTKNQLADILTKGNFTRDEWNHLLTLFNVSHLSSNKTSSTRIKRRTCHSQIATHDEFDREDAFVSSSTSSNPEKTWHGYLTFITHTCEHKQYCFVGSTAKECRLGFFKTPILREILRIPNTLLEEHFVFFGSHTFVPIRWMCRKQTAVSDSSTESEIISGHRTEIGWFARSRTMGSNCFCSWKYFSIVLGNLRVMITNTTNLTTKSI